MPQSFKCQIKPRENNRQYLPTQLCRGMGPEPREKMFWKNSNLYYDVHIFYYISDTKCCEMI